MKSKNYKALIDYAKKNNIKFAVVNGFDEIDSSFDFDGLSLIDTETFEIPCCFGVDRALIMCIDTPADMTPDDTGKSFYDYSNTVNELREICRPQYIAPQGCYIKLMCWCDWVESPDIKDEFIECCNEAINSVLGNLNTVIDFRVWNGNDPTPDIYSQNEIHQMFEDMSNRESFDAEIYANIDGSAYTTGHGIKGDIYHGLKLVSSY